MGRREKKGKIHARMTRDSEYSPGTASLVSERMPFPQGLKKTRLRSKTFCIHVFVCDDDDDDDDNMANILTFYSCGG